MPVLDERTRLRREVEDLCVGEMLVTERGVLVERVHNLRYELVNAARCKVVVGGNGHYRHMSMLLIEEVVEAALDFEAALLRPIRTRTRRSRVRACEEEMEL